MTPPRPPSASTGWERSARYLGCAAVTLTSLFDLDTIVLAGPSFAVAGAIYQTVIQQEVDRRTFARRAHPVKVVPSVNGSDAAAIGGAVLVLHSELALGRSGAERHGTGLVSGERLGADRRHTAGV
jgi:predicted NBD/HSP70 family sugar kinase